MISDSELICNFLKGKTVILVTHQLSLVLPQVDRVIYIDFVSTVDENDEVIDENVVAKLDTVLDSDRKKDNSLNDSNKQLAIVKRKHNISEIMHYCTPTGLALRLKDASFVNQNLTIPEKHREETNESILSVDSEASSIQLTFREHVYEALQLIDIQNSQLSGDYIISLNNADNE